MTVLRQQMIKDLQLRGMADRTQQMYIRAVRMLAQHYQKSPDQITEEELRDYFLYNVNVRKWSRTACTIAICGIKFFYTYTLKREWTTLTLVRPAPEKKLPDILTQEEVLDILDNVKMERHRICLKTIYAMGLRLQEGTHLQVSDIDSGRMLIHIHRGKGNKDRYVPLPANLLRLLRKFWVTHRNPQWIFPAPGRGGIHMPTADHPMPISSVQIAFKNALKKTTISKKVSVHSLRHSYATHLLENGLDLRTIQEYLGHNSPKTTAVYTHLSAKVIRNAYNAINRIMKPLA